MKTQRLIDNRQSQGCKKANGREIIDIPPDVRLWKCEENGVRMPRSNLDFLREQHTQVCRIPATEFGVVQPIVHDFSDYKGVKIRVAM